MKSILALLFSCFFSLQLAFAQAPSAGDQRFTEWMANYYVYKDVYERPDNSGTAEFLKWLDESKMLERHPGGFQSSVAFLTIVFQQNPSRVETWARNQNYSGRAQQAIKYALWLSGNGNLIATIFNDNPEFAKAKPVSLLDWRLRQPGDLDMMWSSFSASGNVTYVKKIIDVLDESNSLTGNEAADKLTRAAAQWSLGANMMQHELVNRLIRREIGARTGAIKTKLEEIVTRNEQAMKPFPNRDGEFQAMLVVIDEKALAEFEKPSNQGMNFTAASKIKLGDTIAIKIVFAGMQLADDLMANVTFDMKIVEPDGTVDPKGDVKNLQALQARMPMRFRVFDNRSFVKLHFDPASKLGKYKIVAEVRDNIGARKVALEQVVELTE